MHGSFCREVVICLWNLRLLRFQNVFYLIAFIFLVGSIRATIRWGPLILARTGCSGYPRTGAVTTNKDHVCCTHSVMGISCQSCEQQMRTS